MDHPLNSSSEIGELADALAKAQAAFPLLERTKTVRVKTKSGGEYTFSYAPLDAVIDAIREPLSNNGLAFVQLFEAGHIVATRLMHTSGQWIESRIVIQPLADENGVVSPQAVGSAITYARRYSLSALLGLADETDDDGNAASGNTAHEEAQKTCPKCGKTGSIIPCKAEWGGGWVCWNKKGGCGAKLQDSDFQEKTPEPNHVTKLRNYLHKEVGCRGPADADVVCWFVSGGSYSTIKAATSSEDDAKAVMNAVLDSIAESKCTPDELLSKADLEYQEQKMFEKVQKGKS